MVIRTFSIDEVIKHGGVRMMGGFRQIKSDLLVLSQKHLDLPTVVYLQEGPDRPHECEDVETLVVNFGKDRCVFLVSGWNQSIKKVAALEEQRRV